MNINYEYITHRGGRSINEDGYSIVKKDDVYCFVLADGLGAHVKGEEASTFACEYITSNFDKKLHTTQDGLRDLLEQANRALIQYQQQIGMREGLRTTIVVLIINGNDILYANVGDSRLYQFIDRKVKFQSKDHSVCQKLVDLGQITQDQVRRHEDRSRLMSVLGEYETLSRVNIGNFTLEPCVFLLCTDGFWENVTEDEMEIDLHKGTTPKEWLDYMFLRAFNAGDKHMDNLSAIAVFIQ